MLKQMAAGAAGKRPRIVNVSGGAKSAMSLAQLSDLVRGAVRAACEVKADGTPRAV